MKWLQEQDELFNKNECDSIKNELWIESDDLLSRLHQSSNFIFQNKTVCPKIAQEILNMIFHTIFKSVKKLISNDGYGFKKYSTIPYLLKLNAKSEWEYKGIIKIHDYSNNIETEFYALNLIDDNNLKIIAFNKTNFEMLKWLLFKAEYYGYIHLRDYNCLTINYINDENNKSSIKQQGINLISQALITFINSEDFNTAVINELNGNNSKMQMWIIAKDKLVYSYDYLSIVYDLRFKSKEIPAKLYLALTDDGKYGIFSKNILTNTFVPEI